MTSVSAQGGQASSAALGQVRTDPVAQAFWLLRAGFTVLPIVVGLD